MPDRKKIGELRPSQFISTFGPGAIMDLPDYSVIIAGIDHWEEERCSPPIEEPRLKKKFGLNKILPLPVPGETWNGYQLPTLPAYRFPQTHVCPECKRIGTKKDFINKHGILYCSGHEDVESYRTENGKKAKGESHASNVKTFPSRFIAACRHGHIDDFPWWYFVHKGNQSKKCRGPLILEEGDTGSISDIKVKCLDCKVERPMSDAFNRNKNALGKCRGHRPWLGKNAREKCENRLRVLLRGASNLYFPVVASALMIPPYSSRIHQSVSKVLNRLNKVATFEDLKQALKWVNFPELEGYDPKKIWEALQDFRKSSLEHDQDLLLPEWKAIIHGTDQQNDDEFQKEEQPVPTGFNGKISRLIKLHRLTEVRIIDSFTRIEPPPDVTGILSGEEDMEDRRAPLSLEKLDWRPGIKIQGEGIFIALDESEVQSWEQREKLLQYERTIWKYMEYQERIFDPPPVRYVLLHTLAHVLMRQLCLSSGYSFSSLRERIYARKPEDGNGMAGILIYTATPDSEGSLGGLVELGTPDRFADMLKTALREASFCTNDPLCSEQSPQHLNGLNGATCHACSMAPETSCERSNMFLDRSLLVPTVSNPDLSFFNMEEITS